MHEDKCQPHHMTVVGVEELTQRPGDELLDSKEASRRMGYSTRWLYGASVISCGCPSLMKHARH